MKQLHPERNTDIETKTNDKKRKKVSTSDKPEKVIRVTPDTQATISMDDLEKENGVSYRGPRFLIRGINQITVKDSNQNLKVYGKILNVSLKRNLEAIIIAEFQGSQCRFVLPESFFTSSNISNDQIRDYLEELGEYVKVDSKDIYICAMCQSHKINIEKIYLYIYEYLYLDFVFEDRQTNGLTNLIIAMR
ncbi:hypothetical protein [Streptococcus massiliensis]|uniref:Uncharacterized protein n=1 Tax=Streptococcus massiliensis TaxID=313439 RepID=A0A380L254_9STRE|nr:hypothetical protein [Streptococcus massiliensis]SUN77317.1 Uncharacterised protein [Streptococcus massiliensis]